jgi:hypothetical protein
MIATRASKYSKTGVHIGYSGPSLPRQIRNTSAVCCDASPVQNWQCRIESMLLLALYETGLLAFSLKHTPHILRLLFGTHVPNVCDIILGANRAFPMNLMPYSFASLYQ